jgi:hypothetical protein
MTKDELLVKLREVGQRGVGSDAESREAAHMGAEDLLLDYIGDPDIKALWVELRESPWYYD